MYFFAPRRCLAFKKKIVLTEKKLVVDVHVGGECFSQFSFTISMYK